MDAQFALRAAYSRVGVIVTSNFFPGQLLPEELARWQELNIKATQEEEAARLEAQGKTTIAIPEAWGSHSRSLGKI